MQDVLLIAAVAAMFAFGLFLMDKLDHFFIKEHHEQNVLRGLSTEKSNVIFQPESAEISRKKLALSAQTK